MSKAKIKTRLSALLEQSEIGDVLEGEDLAFVKSIADPYVYDLDLVVGYGVGISPVRHTKCFVTLRKDGTRCPFSFHRAIDQLPKSTDIVRAFRQSIEKQIHVFKKEHETHPGWVRCTVNERPIPWDDVVVHHEGAEFKDLVAAFLDTEKTKLEDVDVFVKTDRVLLRSSEFEQRWQAFHQEHALLVCLSKNDHKDRH